MAEWRLVKWKDLFVDIYSFEWAYPGEGFWTSVQDPQDALILLRYKNTREEEEHYICHLKDYCKWEKMNNPPQLEWDKDWSKRSLRGVLTVFSDVFGAWKPPISGDDWEFMDPDEIKEAMEYNSAGIEYNDKQEQFLEHLPEGFKEVCKEARRACDFSYVKFAMWSAEESVKKWNKEISEWRPVPDKIMGNLRELAKKAGKALPEEVELLDFEQMGERVKKAFSLACKAHKDQKDKAGQDYILHPMKVASTLEGEESAIIVALLHDVVEDTNVTEKKLKAMKFLTEEEITALWRLTCRREQSRAQYVHDIPKSELAKKVAIPALLHNADFRRITNLQQKDLRRAWKYIQALRWLLSNTKKTPFAIDRILDTSWNSPQEC